MLVWKVAIYIYLYITYPFLNTEFMIMMLIISLIWLIYYYYPLAVKILKFKYMNEKAKPVIMITIGNLVGLL